MMFAGRCGAGITLDGLTDSGSDEDVLSTLFNEELGAVFQVRKGHETRFSSCFATCGPPRGLIRTIGYVRPTEKQGLVIKNKADTVAELDRATMQQWWSSTSFEMQKLRDDPACAQSEFDALLDSKDPGLSQNLTFDPTEISLPTMMTLKSLVGKPRGKSQTIGSIFLRGL